MTKTLTVSTPSDHEIALTRTFNAPPALVFHALTKPDLVKRWMLGSMGASGPGCENESSPSRPTSSRPG